MDVARFFRLQNLKAIPSSNELGTPCLVFKLDELRGVQRKRQQSLERGLFGSGSLLYVAFLGGFKRRARPPFVGMLEGVKPLRKYGRITLCMERIQKECLPSFSFVEMLAGRNSPVDYFEPLRKYGEWKINLRILRSIEKVYLFSTYRGII